MRLSVTFLSEATRGVRMLDAGHMMDAEPDDSLDDSVDYGRLTGHDSSADSQLDSRDLWIRRMCEAQL